MDPFTDLCLFLSLLTHAPPYLYLDEIPIALGYKEFAEQFDQVLDPLLSWLSYIEVLKTPAIH